MDPILKLKYSANDILSQTFSSKWMGYAPEQVDEFHAALATEWTRLANEIENTNNQNHSLKEELKECRRREHTLHDSLQLAKQVANDVREKAEAEALEIIEAAKLEAKKLLIGSERRCAELNEEIQKLEQQRIALENRLRGILQRHLDLLEDLVTKDSKPDTVVVPNVTESADSRQANVEVHKNQEETDTIPKEKKARKRTPRKNSRKKEENIEKALTNTDE